MEPVLGKKTFFYKHWLMSSWVLWERQATPDTEMTSLLPFSKELMTQNSELWSKHPMLLSSPICFEGSIYKPFISDFEKPEGGTSPGKTGPDGDSPWRKRGAWGWVMTGKDSSTGWLQTVHPKELWHRSQQSLALIRQEQSLTNRKQRTWSHGTWCARCLQNVPAHAPASGGRSITIILVFAQISAVSDMPALL